MPMTISPLNCWARAGPAVSTLPATTNSAVARARTCLMGALPPSRPSVREWPDTEIAPDVPPQPVQPLGLHDEEEDDEGAEQHEAEVGDQVEDRLLGEEDAAERLHGVA